MHTLCLRFAVLSRPLILLHLEMKCVPILLRNKFMESEFIPQLCHCNIL